MSQAPCIEADRFAFGALLQPGDHVVCAQVCAEPLTLTRRLVEECAERRLPTQVFVGTLFGDAFDHAPQHMRFLSYGAIGRAAAIADRGALDVLPERYSRLPALFAQGALRADVALLQAARAQDGTLSFGLASDYAIDAARRARAVIVEVNASTPWTHGTPWPRDLRVDAWVQAAYPPLTLAPPRLGAVEQAIAAHVASLVPDGAVVQVGVGALPDATLDALSGHRALGLHSGVLGDAGVRLIEAGVIDNSRKTRDAGISVTNTVCGGPSSYRFVHRNAAVHVRHSDETHGLDALRHAERLHAINAALEVDLSGQVNCEQVQGRQRGGIGGLLDFARAARASAGGRSITVLPATAAGGAASRIVASLDGHPATIGRADVDVVVTEYGVAHLRDVPLRERARRLIAIAAPQFRDALEAGLRCRQGSGA
ncbi:4-hydroxybutyrate CoA-transferase [Verticiella sediminum]|uniref:4-hydroxybutyrate CoA-transferase n=1 Tax=Verticiella sediminum TaxID=1247510 RepID=A0A556AZJ2_9BURK|nr:acetyl-CoA hydrolase/transferase C-terminal domain-containing protein [Verticiella sediminum]TSH98362.1 4-hydroxybutyrate CoA-transferase [Verticiella sediminum]